MNDLSTLFLAQQKLCGVRANFVVDSSGKFSGDSGSSRDLSNSVDLALLRHLRSLSEVIVTDAATARREGYQPSKWAPIEVWSKSGNFEGVSLATGITHRVVIDAEQELKFLRQKYGSVLLETGPTLTKVLAGLGLVDELKLTVVGSASMAEATKTALRVAKSLNLEFLAITKAQMVADTYFFTAGR